MPLTGRCAIRATKARSRTIGCASSTAGPPTSAHMPDVALAAYELIRITESIAAGDPQGREDLFQLAVNGQAD